MSQYDCPCCDQLIDQEENERLCSSCGDTVCKDCIQGFCCETEPLCSDCVKDAEMCVDCGDMFFDEEKSELMACCLCKQYLCCCCTNNPCFDLHRELYTGENSTAEERYLVVCGKCLKKIHQCEDVDRDFNLKARVIEGNVFVSGPETFRLREWFKSNGFKFMKDAWIISETVMSVKELRSRLEKEKRRYLLDYDLVVFQIDTTLNKTSI